MLLALYTLTSALFFTLSGFPVWIFLFASLPELTYESYIIIIFYYLDFRLVSPDKSSIELSGLSPHKAYEIKVQALTRSNQGKIKSVNHQTQEAGKLIHLFFAFLVPNFALSA